MILHSILLVLLTLIGLLSAEVNNHNSGVVSSARLTYYNSYPPCCPNSPNYDPKADKSECDDYSGCDYIGDFAAIGHKSLSYVQT